MESVEPAASPPCPYTTLFRSERGDRQLLGRLAPEHRPRLPPAGPDVEARPPVEALDRPDRPDRRRAPVEVRDDRDRKSTPLNSSHLVSSYAVFCLKKKT